MSIRILCLIFMLAFPVLGLAQTKAEQLAAHPTRQLRGDGPTASHSEKSLTTTIEMKGGEEGRLLSDLRQFALRLGVPLRSIDERMMQSLLMLLRKQPTALLEGAKIAYKNLCPFFEKSAKELPAKGASNVEGFYIQDMEKVFDTLYAWVMQPNSEQPNLFADSLRRLEKVGSIDRLSFADWRKHDSDYLIHLYLLGIIGRSIYRPWNHVLSGLNEPTARSRNDELLTLFLNHQHPDEDRWFSAQQAGLGTMLAHIIQKLGIPAIWHYQLLSLPCEPVALRPANASN